MDIPRLAELKRGSAFSIFSASGVTTMRLHKIIKGEGQNSMSLAIIGGCDGQNPSPLETHHVIFNGVEYSGHFEIRKTNTKAVVLTFKTIISDPLFWEAV